jgi:lysophospholipase L1-like esterase
MRSMRLIVVFALGVAGIVAAAPRDGRADAFAPDAYYRLRMDLFAVTPLAAGDIVFLGDSITEGAEWNELFPDLPVRDRGISGDTTAGVLARLGTVTASRPAAVFLLVGTNELAPSLDPAPSLARQREILARIRRESPDTRVFVQSLLPRAAAYRERVESYNTALRGICREAGVSFIDLYPAFLAADGSLRDELTFDELHLAGAGYRLWRSLLAPHLESLRATQAGADAR